MRHVTIYHQLGRFAGWPANYGMWHWGDEIVLGFTVGAHKSNKRGHAIDKRKPVRNMQARSLDRGATWQIEAFKGARPGGRGLSADEHMDAGLRLGQVMTAETAPTAPQPLNFTGENFAIMLARTGLARGVFSFFYVSDDRCRSWAGPYRLPMFGCSGIAARNDTIVQSENSALLFLTANKADGKEGKVICVRTDDGGQSFALRSEVGGEQLREGDFAIMPSSLALPSGRILCARRCRQGASGLSWIDVYASDDGGSAWRLLSRPVDFQRPGHSGNPPCLKRLSDGRLLLLYGNRDSYSICARISCDDGETWGGEIGLRAGGATGDMGYPRAVVLDEDCVVAAYYINDRPDGDGERFIEATLWRP